MDKVLDIDPRYIDALSIKDLYFDQVIELDPNYTYPMASWTKSAVGYAVEKSRFDTVQRLKALHAKAVSKTDIDDVGSEISGLYNCAFEFKNAEMNLQTVAKLAENTVDEESLPVVESHIDRFGSVLRNAIIRAYGMLTSTAKDLKDKIISNLKETAKEFKSKLKDRFIDAFNKAAEFSFLF